VRCGEGSGVGDDDCDDGGYCLEVEVMLVVMMLLLVVVVLLEMDDGVVRNVVRFSVVWCSGNKVKCGMLAKMSVKMLVKVGVLIVAVVAVLVMLEVGVVVVVVVIVVVGQMYRYWWRW
jgi:hypothetical protein